MQLKRLEAYGFKTFADRIEVEFDKGITAIVGPNGSGKSNISDAVKWALGEQNVRNIRGTKAEDVIFNGSSSRRAMGVAEVSLTFDNDGTLPVDFQEVKITRRLFRNGDSEFYINKARCRLKDIINLFADTGIGHDSMGIISQNKIDDILNARPEEKRLFFEEAAGITKYRNRKKESMRKLEDTEANLLRVQDIIGEIETRLEPLKISAEKTEKYNSLQEELKKYSLAEIYLGFLGLNKKKAKQSVAINEKKDQEIAAKTALQLSETRKEQFNKVILELEKEQESIANRKNELHGKIESAESDIKVLEERRRQGKTSRQLLTQQINELNAAAKEAEADIELAEQGGAESKKTLEDVIQRITKCRQRAKVLREDLQVRRNQRSSIEVELEKDLQILNQKSSELMILERDLANDGEVRSSQGEKLKTISAHIAEMEKQKDTLAVTVQKSLTEKSNQEMTIAQTEKKMESIDGQLEEITGKKNENDTRLQKIISRLQIMEKLQQSYEGFGKAVKQVLTSKAPWRNGICGTVAELLDVPGKYITAVETALGAGLQNIVTKDTDTAKEAIAYLKRDRLGRVTFLPLSSIVVRQNQEQLPADVSGVIGWAKDIVGSEVMYKDVVDFLLGRTLVVDTLDNAVRLNKRMGQRLRIVTLEGELLSPGGAMTGGSHQHRESSFLNRQGEIKDLREQKDIFTREAQQLKEKYGQLQQEKKDTDVTLLGLKDELHRMEMEVQGQQLRCATLEDELAREKAEMTSVNEALVNAQENYSAREERATLLRRELDRQQADNADLKNKLTGLIAEYDELDKEADEVSEEANRLEHQQTVHEQNILRIKEKILLCQRELTRNQETLSQNEKEIRRLDDELEQSQNQIGVLITKTRQLQDDFAVAKDEYKKIYDNRMEKLVESQKNEKEIKESQRRLNGIQDELHALELEGSRTDYDLDQLQQEMLSKYGILPERAADMVPDMEPSVLKRELRRLEKDINSLGTVNPNAPEEYRELVERHGFLAGNADDLIAAKKDLLKIIGEMDATMTRQFKEAFNKINVFFNDTFIRLFGGGEGKILLKDKDNVLESGVDIVVQIPDKKKQNLAVLSGGERALTVVALLFSFLQYRPAPFSLLDEIDAPLDEANIGRFGSFLEKFSANTQFIVVTHRKGTMEAADAMYGVTVEDAGVSKILSVKLKEAEDMVED
ncbi:MAG: chromosome segregation protein SMC [Anaerovibrio sp.]|uniref:chromosome segregation protein SMC n=1 Tax=Anaerovibrio sp. TaxID=1872532 RepID=UPI0025FA37C6|nr:chromosome segregation protein SMC [Anaerovibrio sp.]MCR5177261.1 chromosome segregation protein SMC [Anaerovibrio sp.]